MARRFTPLLASIIFTAVGIGTAQASMGGTPDPYNMFKALLTYDSLGQYDRAYGLLNPWEKKLVSKSQFVTCSQSDTPAFDLVSLKKLDEYATTLIVRGIPTRKFRAVTLRITISENGVKTPSTLTLHAVWYRGRWTDVLPPSDLTAYEHDSCP